LQLATAPVSWGIRYPTDQQQISWRNCLDEMAAAGFIWTELGPPGFIPGSSEEIGIELQIRELRLCAASVQGSLADPKTNQDLILATTHACDALASLGGSTLVIIDGRYSDRLSTDPLSQPLVNEENWLRIMQTAHDMAQIAVHDYGLQAAFHPHTDTHIETPENTYRFLEEMDNTLLGICLDTGHLAYCGIDPIEFTKRYIHQISHVHLKNIDLKFRERVLSNRIPYVEAVAQGIFTNPQAGSLDLQEIVRLLEVSEYDGFIVMEQDMYPAPSNKPLPIAIETKKFMSELGLI